MENSKLAVVLALAEAFEVLPDNKKEYLLGFAEGIIAARMPENAPEHRTEKEDKDIA